MTRKDYSQIKVEKDALNRFRVAKKDDETNTDAIYRIIRQAQRKEDIEKLLREQNQILKNIQELTGDKR